VIYKAIFLILIVLVILFPKQTIYNNKQCSSYLFGTVLSCKDN
jgi:hypothetical protein